MEEEEIRGGGGGENKEGESWGAVTFLKAQVMACTASNGIN